MQSISLLRTFSNLINSDIERKIICIDNFHMTYRKNHCFQDVIFGFKEDDESFQYLFDISLDKDILRILSNLYMEKISIDILKELESHTDLELILKYGRCISDVNLVDLINKSLNIDITIDDLNSFIEQE